MADMSSLMSSGFYSLSLTTITSSLFSVTKLITASAWLMGISFIIKAIYSMKSMAEQKTQQSTHTNIKEPMFYLLAGAMLIYLPTAVQIFLNSTFGQGAQILAYAPIDSGSSTLSNLFGQGSSLGPIIALVVQVIGVIAFIRGWVLIARSASQGQPPGGTGKGLAHVFGGIMAMNIVGTLQVVNNTLFGA